MSVLILSRKGAGEANISSKKQTIRNTRSCNTIDTVQVASPRKGDVL